MQRPCPEQCTLVASIIAQVLQSATVVDEGLKQTRALQGLGGGRVEGE